MTFSERSGVPVAEPSRLDEDELREWIRARPLPRHVAIIMDGNGVPARSREPP